MLRREGIVVRRAEGKRACYRIKDPTVTRLFRLVCGGLVERLSDNLDALTAAQLWKDEGI